MILQSVCALEEFVYLVEAFPDFVSGIAALADEFRMIKGLLEEGAPAKHPVCVAVLHTWGGLRPWTLSGHFHETYMHDLIHISEALAGLPFDVTFLNFTDVKTRNLSQYQVIINAGRAGTAWSGGSTWADDEVVERLTEWTARGGVFLGVNESLSAKYAHLCGDHLHISQKMAKRMLRNRVPA